MEKDDKVQKIPLILIIGEDGAGKSSFINYSNIEYPLSDNSHLIFLYMFLKKPGFTDTERNYFSQEKFFIPSSSDEFLKDDLDKNKEFLIKKYLE